MSGGVMKHLLLLLYASVAFGQLPADFVAAGGSYNQYGVPQVSGTALYAHQLQPGTYSFSLVDLFVQRGKPLTNSMTTGVAQHIRDVGPAKIFVVASIGAATTTDNAGWIWTGGGTAVIPLKGRWVILPNIRVMKSSISDTQYAIGILVGYGK